MKPATPLRLLTAAEVSQWPAYATSGRYFLAVANPEHAARLFNRDRAYPRLVEALRALADNLSRYDVNIALALLRELGEEQ